ncbi:uncharacterized protein DSM5745_09499 [Aspergillus mulundensis]|uniref:Uncharacterized protein n=1 Tax=Aspergillus mulundensis TaxID=1810919 RepID=A0A3D8QVS1_9EURO|nr:hypothetical protein DSM5745_09499 [Aspergillus mulundensis]RDW65760.1 hypothetical protein DSM5745_09499 [Aspergillus mulundensis]
MHVHLLLPAMQLALALLPLHTLASPAPSAENHQTDTDSPSPNPPLAQRAVTTCKVINANSEVNCRAGPGFDYAMRTFVYPGGTWTCPWGVAAQQADALARRGT